MTPDVAYRVLGIDPGADRDEVRAAFRRRMWALHPDVAGGDAGQAGQTMTRDVIDAYRRLCEPTNAPPTRQPADDAAPTGVPAESDPSPFDVLRGPNPRLVRVAMASTLVLAAGVFAVFFLFAFSQSGR